MDLVTVADVWRREGFVVLPGYLAGSDLDLAISELPAVFPTAEQYHSDPSSEGNSVFTEDEYGGLIPFPFPSVRLCNLAVHERVISLVETAFGTQDIRIYASDCGRGTRVRSAMSRSITATI